jgi:hypothetical protein
VEIDYKNKILLYLNNKEGKEKKRTNILNTKKRPLYWIYTYCREGGGQKIDIK